MKQTAEMRTWPQIFHAALSLKSTPTFQNNSKDVDDDDDNDNCDDAASTVLGKVTQSYLKTFNLYVPHFERFL